MRLLDESWNTGTWTLLSVCLSGFEKGAEHMCSRFSMSTLHLMPEWEQDGVFCFVLHLVVFQNTTVISKLWNLTTKKDSFANVQIINHICVSMYDCNRKNKLNPCHQISIFYCACVSGLCCCGPSALKDIPIRMFNFQEKSCSKDCLRI